ncbi:glycosyltransferase family 39 protein, partial [Candidatus Omnitrophota bacterium]
MRKDKRKKDNVTDEPIRNERIKTGVTSVYAVYAVFAVIGIVYCLSLLVLYPNLPITTRQADSIQGYDLYYPPFRTDEYNYYDIANNILSGNLYEDGSFERSYPLGFPLVTVPFVAVLDKMGGYAANVVIVLLSLILFFKVIRRFNSTTHALALVAVLAFATLNWFYAVSCYSEPLAQLLVLLAVYCMFSGKDSSKKTLFFIAAGCATGLNLFVRPHYIVIAVPFFVSLWLQGKSRFSLKNHGILYAAGVSAVIFVWFIRNSIVFGGPLTFEYTRMLGQFVPGSIEGGVKGNVFTGTHRLLFDEFHGLLTITPVLLVFPAGLNRMWQRGFRNEAVTFLVSVIVMIVIFASGPYPFTEFGLGSRHMMPM